MDWVISREVLASELQNVTVTSTSSLFVLKPSCHCGLYLRLLTQTYSWSLLFLIVTQSHRECSKRKDLERCFYSRRTYTGDLVEILKKEKNMFWQSVRKFKTILDVIKQQKIPKRASGCALKHPFLFYFSLETISQFLPLFCLLFLKPRNVSTNNFKNIREFKNENLYRRWNEKFGSICVLDKEEDNLCFWIEITRIGTSFTFFELYYRDIFK